MFSFRSFQGSFTTRGNPFTRHSVLAARRGGSRQPGISVTSAKPCPLSLLFTQCRPPAPFRTQHYALTTFTKTSSPEKVRRFSISSASPSSSPSSSSSSPSWPLQTRKAPVRTHPMFWSIEANTTMLELMRDNVKRSDMVPYFPNHTKNAIDKHASTLCKRLKLLGAKEADLNKEEIMMAMISKTQEPLRWSKEQDELLQILYKEHGSNWKLIASVVSEGGRERNNQKQQQQQRELFPKRTGSECRTQIEASHLIFNRGPWSKEEVDRLWKSIKEVKEEYRSIGQRFRTLGLNALENHNNEDVVVVGRGDYDDDDDVSGGGKNGTKFVDGFWLSVAEKVKTRNARQSGAFYTKFMRKKKTEGADEGPKSKPWTIEELEALRDLKVGKTKGWEYNEDIDKSSEDNKMSNRRILTDEKRQVAHDFLLKSHSEETIRGRVEYLQRKARLHSLPVMEYFEEMIARKRRLGHSEEQKKVRQELIAARLNSTTAVHVHVDKKDA